MWRLCYACHIICDGLAYLYVQGDEYFLTMLIVLYNQLSMLMNAMTLTMLITTMKNLSY